MINQKNNHYRLKNGRIGYGLHYTNISKCHPNQDMEGRIILTIGLFKNEKLITSQPP